MSYSPPVRPDPTIDPNHEFLHRVPRPSMDRYKEYLTDEVTALCGKTWSPDRFAMNLDKPECPGCFPKRPKYAWAA